MSREPTSRRSGRPPLTDRHALLAAAREIGFARLTVGAVTAAVGVKYSTFYRHFPSLTALTSALVDQVCEQELVLPAQATCWQDTVSGMCAELTLLEAQYPGMAAAVLSLPQLPEQVIVIYRRLTDTLVEAGFDAEQAAAGAVCALETVAITAMTTPGPGGSPIDRQHQIDTIEPSSDLAARAVAATLTDRSTGARAARKIGLIVRGLEAELATRSDA